MTFLGKEGIQMWITSEVEIPEELFDNLEQGKLVLFVGAGVSMKGKSNLPNFDDLVDEIAEALYVEKREITEPHDYYLGKIARTKDVHQAAKDLVNVKESKPNPLHYAILRLFSEDTDVRIVTTNFDQHFTTVIQEMKRNFNIYYAPALPTGRSFKGLAYIHGNIEQEKENLILTDGDFGRAYLTEGWARRFLVDLFSNYTVLFIGYSHNDPVMKYLATGLPPSTRRYAFVAQGDNTYHWEHLGISPIVYPNKANNHQALVKAVKRWAELMGDNYITKRMRIRDIVTVPPSLEQEQLSYIKQSIKKIETLRYFVEFARDYEWVEWLEAEGKLQNLFLISSRYDEADELLAEWLVEHFLFSHQKELFQLIFKNHSKISPLLWQTICIYLKETNKPMEPLLFTKWTLLLLETAENNSHSIEKISYLLYKCSFPEHKEISVLLLTFILDGKIKLKRVRRWENDMQDSIELEESSRLSVPVFSHVQRIWDEKMKPHISYFADPIMVMGLEKIQMLSLKQAALQKRDGVLYNTMEFSEHDLQPKDFTFLIRIINECLTYLCENNKEKASYYIAQMIGADSILQKRIAIEAMSKNRFVAADEKLKWLLHQRLLLDFTYKHEVFQFLKKHYPVALEETKQEVLQKVMKQLIKERAFDACLVLDLLYTCDSNSNCTVEAYNIMKQKHPHFSSDRYSEKKEEVIAQSIICNVTADGLLRLKEHEIKKQVMLFSNDGIFEQRHFLEMLSKACKLNTDWSISLAYQLVGEHQVSNEVWFVCIREWRNNRKLTNQQIQKIIPLLQQFVRKTVFHWLISSFLYEISNRLEEFEENSIRAVKRFAFSLFPQVMKGAANFKVGEQDFYNASIQHPVGKMTSVLLKLLAYDHLYDRNIYEYLFLFEEQVQRASECTNFMFARLTADVTFLYHIEKQWCRKYLLPYLDLKKENEAIKYAWAGLCYTQINLPLFTEIKRYIKYAVEHLNLLHPHTKQVFLKWLSFVFIKCVLYWGQRTDWVYPIFIQEKENDKIKFIEHLCYYVKTLSVREQQKFWDSWLSRFLRERPKMSIITGREYVMFLRFVLCMNEVAEKGLHIILNSFPLPLEHYKQEETKELFTIILKKRESVKYHVQSYAKLFFVLLQTLQEAYSVESEIIQIKEILVASQVEHDLFISIQNEMIRIGIVMANLQEE
ncbi:hypothetical protein CON65_17400 [Bacillus pseudomycoides]|uniref:DUF4020 domain-containing protein n=1 Tax=Bacillus pseudomycoides TaxID=64104 RepID=A0AA91ZS72_9BACI|nr:MULTISPECIES: DUF4020 domain-containing protein [Bacillus]PEB56194.1 hypothetical protein COO03_01600 [Bacillus sp. AFS098217]PED81400.1 hypothetical protein CON65_17400 [Bacillus pseudomycoides]PEU11317.1 hypothetical protein CN524_14810 [Bacillus sp. AFS019443]PEU18347.1 hypothetical protein CN525_12160 [Bacillus sp. AFS014408]PFW60034.1 hypothetical protein COL20_23495 [Bacillus sp. AFS075034]